MSTHIEWISADDGLELVSAGYDVRAREIVADYEPDTEHVTDSPAIVSGGRDSAAVMVFSHEGRGALVRTLRDLADEIESMTLEDAYPGTSAFLMPGAERATCRHCGRDVVQLAGAWVDPEATGDDAVWRETCDAHDTFTAEHEPATS